MGRARRRRVLGQGPDEGRSLGGVHLPADGEVGGEERPLEARAGAAVVRDRRCEAALALRRDVHWLNTVQLSSISLNFIQRIRFFETEYSRTCGVLMFSVSNVSGLLNNIE